MQIKAKAKLVIVFGVRSVKKMKETTVLGIKVSVTTKEEVLSLVKDAIQSNRKLTLVAINACKVMRAKKDEKTARLLESFDVFLADGASIVKASAEVRERITGVDLMETLCAHGKVLGLRIFLYGAKSKHNQRAQQALRHRFPGLQIVGSCDGYQDADVVERINHSGANIVFVAKGTPAQEYWIAAHKQEVCANVFLGVGGALDVWSGAVRRAPAWIQRLGLEWLYRMLLQPKHFIQLPWLIHFQWLVQKDKRKRQVREHGITEERN